MVPSRCLKDEGLSGESGDFRGSEMGLSLNIQNAQNSTISVLHYNISMIKYQNVIRHNFHDMRLGHHWPFSIFSRTLWIWICTPFLVWIPSHMDWGTSWGASRTREREGMSHTSSHQDIFSRQDIPRGWARPCCLPHNTGHLSSCRRSICPSPCPRSVSCHLCICPRPDHRSEVWSHDILPDLRGSLHGRGPGLD